MVNDRAADVVFSTFLWAHREDIIKMTKEEFGLWYDSNLARIRKTLEPRETEDDIVANYEVDLMDRIITGLPIGVKVITESDEFTLTPRLYDVNSLYPQEVKIVNVVSPYPEPTWYRIPEFENYEVNELGVVRNRWTRREIEVATIGHEKSVEMHDKDGFAHEVNIRRILEWVFGK